MNHFITDAKELAHDVSEALHGHNIVENITHAFEDIGKMSDDIGNLIHDIEAEKNKEIIEEKKLNRIPDEYKKNNNETKLPQQPHHEVAKALLEASGIKTKTPDNNKTCPIKIMEEAKNASIDDKHIENSLKQKTQKGQQTIL